MMRGALLLLALVLAGCTGQNVDESFLSTHGAVLARVECLSADTPGIGRYWAVMFLDGSAIASKDGETFFFERSDPGREHAPVGRGLLTGAPLVACGDTYEEIYRIDNGELVKDRCEGNPASRNIYVLKDIDTDCSGFNKSLFD